MIDFIGYDAAGRTPNINCTNGTDTKFDFDPVRHFLQSIAVRVKTNTLFSATYTHYPDGRIKTVRSATNRMKIDAKYDEGDRLQRVSEDVNESFEYDLAGNMEFNSGRRQPQGAAR